MIQKASRDGGQGPKQDRADLSDSGTHAGLEGKVNGDVEPNTGTGKLIQDQFLR